MVDIIHDDEQIQSIIREILIGCIPERGKELSDFWDDFQLKLRLTPDTFNNEKIIFQGGAYREIWFNFRVLIAFWIGSFAAWEGYSAIFHIFDRQDDYPVSDNFDKLKKCLSAFDTVVSSNCETNITLPSFIPELGKLPKNGENMDWQAAAELATLAMGWAFLHEVRHIQHQQQGTSGCDEITRRSEELDCDTFATNFMLDKAQEYSISTRENLESVIRKRQLGIYFALFTVTLLAKDNWEETISHPAVTDRIRNVKSHINPTKDKIAEAICHSAFVALNSIWANSPLDL